jgi:hypothetical protein
MAGTKISRVGNSPLVELLPVAVAAGAAAIYGGNLVATNALGYGVIATASSALRIVGIAQTDLDNSAGTATQYLNVQRGAYLFRNGSGINALGRADVFANVYWDGTYACKTDGGGTYPLLGYMLPAGGTDNLGTGASDSGKVSVQVGFASPFEASSAASAAFKARAVATSLAAFTQTAGVILADAVGAVGTQDGVSTLAAGDVIFLPLGTVGAATVAAADVGPWVISVLGGAVKYQLVRPSWYRHGSAIVPATVIEVGGEGTLFGGTAWKSFAAGSLVVGTGAPLFYPNQVVQSAVLVAGTVPLANVPVRSATKTAVSFNRTTPNTASSTVQYNASTITPGALGTASIVVQAQVAAGTINVADISTLNVAVSNW